MNQIKIGFNVERKRQGLLLSILAHQSKPSLDHVHWTTRANGFSVQKDLPARLVGERIELAFIALHGRYGEDGCVQGLLESMFIPYTGSGVLASSVGMEKVFAKQIFIAEGIPTPRHVAFRTSADARINAGS